MHSRPARSPSLHLTNHFPWPWGREPGDVLAPWLSVCVGVGFLLFILLEYKLGR